MLLCLSIQFNWSLLSYSYYYTQGSVIWINVSIKLHTSATTQNIPATTYLLPTTRGAAMVSGPPGLEVFTEDPRPEDPGPDLGPVRVRVYNWNGQSGPGRVPIYYFGSRVFLTLCVIPESIGEHRTRQRSVSVSMRVCNLQFVKLGWEQCEREIRWKKKNTRYLSRQKQSAGGVNVVLQADGDHGFLHEWCGKKAETKLKRRTCYCTRTQ